MFYRLVTSVCFMAICTEVVYSAAIKGMKAQNGDLAEKARPAVEVKQSVDDHKEEHFPDDSDMDSKVDDWLFEYLDTSPPSKPDDLITPDKRFGFVGSRGKKRRYGFMGSRGKRRYGFMGSRGKRRYGFMGSRGKRKNYGFMGSRGKKNNVGIVELEDNKIRFFDDDFAQKSLETDKISTNDGYNGNEKRAPHFGFHGSRG